MHERRFDQAVSRLRDPQRVERLEVDRVVDLALDDFSPTSVLDVGIGSGLFAEKFAARSLQVSGVDTNPDMLKAAKEYVPGAVLKQGEAESLPFEDAQFDLVFLALVLHETDDPQKALREARRVGRHRVAVLEWPYLQQEFGPPLEHRLLPEKIQELGTAAGLGSAKMIPLQHLILYRFDI